MYNKKNSTVLNIDNNYNYIYVQRRMYNNLTSVINVIIHFDKIKKYHIFYYA